uniref:Uncharacterized protein n=1 Tax=Romanomermis culicivorax TaxID=13658 RepID=A0A915IZC9_ROMCU
VVSKKSLEITVKRNVLTLYKNKQSSAVRACVRVDATIHSKREGLNVRQLRFRFFNCLIFSLSSTSASTGKFLSSVLLSLLLLLLMLLSSSSWIFPHIVEKSVRRDDYQIAFLNFERRRFGSVRAKWIEDLVQKIQNSIENVNRNFPKIQRP